MEPESVKMICITAVIIGFMVLIGFGAWVNCE